MKKKTLEVLNNISADWRVPEMFSAVGKTLVQVYRVKRWERILKETRVVIVQNLINHFKKIILVIFRSPLVYVSLRCIWLYSNYIFCDSYLLICTCQFQRWTTGCASSSTDSRLLKFVCTILRLTLWLHTLDWHSVRLTSQMLH